MVFMLVQAQVFNLITTTLEHWSSMQPN